MEFQYEKLTKAIHDHFSANELDHCVEMAAEDVQVVAHAFGLTFNGRNEFRDFMQGFKQAFPDLRIEHQNIVNHDGRVAVEFTAYGTHTGPLETPAGTIPPSGNEVVLNVAEFYEWENGQFRKMSNYQDAGSLMRQIGAM